MARQYIEILTCFYCLLSDGFFQMCIASFNFNLNLAEAEPIISKQFSVLSALQFFCPLTREWWRLFVMCKTWVENATESTSEGLASAHTLFCSLSSIPKQELRVPDRTYDLSLKNSNDFIYVFNWFYFNAFNWFYL